MILRFPHCICFCLFQTEKRQTRSGRETQTTVVWENKCNEFLTPLDLWPHLIRPMWFFITLHSMPDEIWQQSYPYGSICHWTPKPCIIIRLHRQVQFSKKRQMSVAACVCVCVCMSHCACVFVCMFVCACVFVCPCLYLNQRHQCKILKKIRFGQNSQKGIQLDVCCKISQIIPENLNLDFLG